MQNLQVFTVTNVSLIYLLLLYVYNHLQLFWERLSEKMCRQQSRKVIWDRINTLFLTLADEPYFCCFPLALTNIRPLLLLSIFQISLKNSELKTTHNTFRDYRWLLVTCVVLSCAKPSSFSLMDFLMLKWDKHCTTVNISFLKFYFRLFSEWYWIKPYHKISLLYGYNSKCSLIGCFLVITGPY